jgi:hypothetical protein
LRNEFSVTVLPRCSTDACCECLSLVGEACDTSPNRAVTCNISCLFVRDLFVCLFSKGMSHTSGEAAFPRPRLGQVLTPLGVNNIALARTVMTACVKLNCHIYQSGRMSVIWLRGPWLWAMSSALPRARRAGHRGSAARYAFQRCTEFLICRKRNGLRGQLACHREA